MRVLENDLPVFRPVTIVLESREELDWAYAAFANAVHVRKVLEDSIQQTFYGRVHGLLNSIATKYRHGGIRG